MIDLNQSYVEGGKTRVGLHCNMQESSLYSLARMERYETICDLNNVHVLSGFRYDYRMLLTCHGHRVALADVDVLCNCLCSIAECQGLAVSDHKFQMPEAALLFLNYFVIYKWGIMILMLQDDGLRTPLNRC